MDVASSWWRTDHHRRLGEGQGVIPGLALDPADAPGLPEADLEAVLAAGHVLDPVLASLGAEARALGRAPKGAGVDLSAR